MLGVAIVLESLSMRTAAIEANRVRGNASWVRFVRSSRTPELPVVLLEDLGALVGLVLALGALVIAVVFDAPVWDGVGTLSIGVLLGLIAVVLAIEMRSLLLGEGATAADADAIRQAIVSTEGVTGLIHLRTQHIGPEELLVAAKVGFDPGYSTVDLADAIKPRPRPTLGPRCPSLDPCTWSPTFWERHEHVAVPTEDRHGAGGGAGARHRRRLVDLGTDGGRPQRRLRLHRD